MVSLEINLLRITTKVKSVNRSVELTARLRGLPAMKVLVGVSEAGATRPKTAPINNAQLTYIHTHGSPLRNIPARPIIEPALTARGNKEPIQEELKLAAAAQLAGDSAKATQHLRRAGVLAQNAVRAWFTDSRNNWAPNAPSTIARKHSARPLIDTGELRPLIATGELRKSMTYVVVPPPK